MCGVKYTFIHIHSYKHFFPFPRFRTSVERTNASARTTQLVSLVLHRKDIDVRAQQDLRATTVRMVTMLLLAFPYALCSC